jgi:ribosomal protein S18 acetylase RimI-like enzyme
MIRPMSVFDLDTIVSLEREHQLHPWPKAAFEQAIRLGQNCQVFEENGTITAYGVSNKGHGRTVMALSVAGADVMYRSWFEHAGDAPFLWAQIEPENRAARVRLKRFGFEKAGRVPSLYGPGIDGEVWRKRTQEYRTDQASG